MIFERRRLKNIEWNIVRHNCKCSLSSLQELFRLSKERNKNLVIVLNCESSILHFKMSRKSFKPENLTQQKNEYFHEDDENSLIVHFNDSGKINEQTKLKSELQGKEKDQHHDDPMDRQKRDLAVVNDLLKEAQMMIDLPEETILNSADCEKVG